MALNEVKTNAGPPAGHECSFTERWGAGKTRGPKTNDVRHQDICRCRQIAAAPTKMLIEGGALQNTNGRPVLLKILPMTSAATPVSAAAEQQHQNNDNQDQFHSKSPR